MNNIELLHKYGEHYKRSNFGEFYKIIENIQANPKDTFKGKDKSQELFKLFTLFAQQIKLFKGIIKNDPVSGIHKKEIIKLLTKIGFKSVRPLYVKGDETNGIYFSWITFYESKNREFFGFYIQYNDVPEERLLESVTPKIEIAGKPYHVKHEFEHPEDLKEEVKRQNFEMLMYAARYFRKMTGDERFKRLKATEKRKLEAIEICNQILSYKGLVQEIPVIIPSHISLNLFIKGALLYIENGSTPSLKKTYPNPIPIGNRYFDFTSQLYYEMNTEIRTRKTKNRNDGN